jgi:hypothetical protein
MDMHPRSIPRIRWGQSLCLIVALIVAAMPATAQVAPVRGVVTDASSGAALVGARVHIRASPDTPVVLTGADGTFELPIDASSGSSFQVSAAVGYDASAAINYETTAVSASPGAQLSIALRRIPAVQNTAYLPIAAAPPGGCGNCHTEQYAQWQSSNHAHAVSNAWVRDLYSGDGTGPATGPSGDGYVFLENHAGPGTGFCATCHAANERPSDPASVRFNEVVSAAGREGVTCTTCHQLHEVNDNVDAIHLLGNAEFSFPASTTGGGASLTHQHVWGPLDDVVFGQMRPAYAPVFFMSRFCASCHEYDNPASGAPGQETYSEWLQSPAASAGQQCQDCHMPSASTPGRLASVGQAPVRPGSQRHDHSFPGVYSGRLQNPVELGVTARVAAGRVEVDTSVLNRVLGHNFPTGVDVRNAFLLVQASIEGDLLEQVEGDRLPFWVDDDVAGQQPGDYSGYAGRGYAKVLQGRIDGLGEVLKPVPFIDAESVFSHTTIAPGATDQEQFAFALPATAQVGQTIEIRAWVYYRRAWRSIAVTKNWVVNNDGEPWERLVAQTSVNLLLDAAMLDPVMADGFEGEVTRTP